MALTPEKAELIIGDLRRELAWSRMKIQSLEEQLRLERIKWLGKKSETLSDLQLQLLAEEEPGVCSEEVEAEALREPVKEVPPRRRPHPGRRPLPAHLPRVEAVLACESLEPVSQAMRAELLACGYLQVDETTVPVQVPDKSGANHQGYLWQYGQPGGGTVFDFRMGREREGPVQFLGKWEGILQTDGYQAYDNIGGPKLVHVGCWAHARRYFVDAVKVNEKDREAIKMVTRMDALFTVDREARKQQLTAEQRLALRREHAESWVEEIHAACLFLKNFTLPKSALGQAVQYTLNQWPRLRRCFDYGEVELSNNLAENSMRPIALAGRTGSTSAVRRPGPRWRPFSRSSNLAGD